MPVHKIPRASLHEDLQSLEREGESIVTVTLQGDFYIVTTKFHGNNVETRPLYNLTHETRLGVPK